MTKAAALLPPFSKCAIAVILALALILRLDFVLRYDFPKLEWDQQNYTVMAVQMMEEGVYGYRSTEPNAFVPPGFPLFLAAVFKLFGYESVDRTLDIVRLLHCFLSLIGIWYLYRIACLLLNRAVGLIAAFFASVYAPFIFVTGLILTEVLFVDAFLAAVYYQVRIIRENRRRDHIIAGILIGVSTLIRPNTVVAAVIPYLFLWMEHRKLYLRHILWAAGMFSLVMLPWWIRNIVTLEKFVLLSEGSGNPLLGGTNPYGKVPFDPAQMNRHDDTEYALLRIVEGLRTDPWLWIRWFTLGKFTEMFWDTFYGGLYSVYVGPGLQRLHQWLHKGIVLCGFVFSLFALWSRPVRFLAAHLFLFLAIQLLFVPEARYTIGMMPFLMIITAWVIVTAVRGLMPHAASDRLTSRIREMKGTE